MIPISFRQLEVFVRVVEAGSLRAAAERLSITQVSVSEHVRALEGHLGCTLLERRRGSTPVLTQNGERVLVQARAILSSTVDLLSTFDRVPRDLRKQRVRIGAHGFIAESLARKVARFASTHPEVDISLERRSFVEIASGLNQGEIEVGYFLARGPVAEMESALAWEEELALFTGPDHPLAHRAHVEPGDLCGLPFVYLPPRTHLRGEITAIMDAIGIANCPAALTTDDHRLIVDHLLEGEGFACLFANRTTHGERGDKLARLCFSRSIPPLHIRCAVRPAYRTDRTVSAMLAFFEDDRPDRDITAK
jgi:DNA-binding transcriptional LysR family regulator